MEFSVKSNGNECDYIINGDNLTDAIEKNFQCIGDKERIGNPAGWTLHNVSACYRDDIFGGAGGVQLTIVAIGQPLAHNGKTGPEKTTTVWIHSDDKTYSHEFELG